MRAWLYEYETMTMDETLELTERNHDDSREALYFSRPGTLSNLCFFR